MQDLWHVTSVGRLLEPWRGYDPQVGNPWSRLRCQSIGQWIRRVGAHDTGKIENRLTNQRRTWRAGRCRPAQDVWSGSDSTQNKATEPLHRVQDSEWHTEMLTPQGWVNNRCVKLHVRRNSTWRKRHSSSRTFHSTQQYMIDKPHTKINLIIWGRVICFLFMYLRIYSFIYLSDFWDKDSLCSPWLTWNLLHGSGWPRTQDKPLALACFMLRL